MCSVLSFQYSCAKHIPAVDFLPHFACLLRPLPCPLGFSLLLGGTGHEGKGQAMVGYMSGTQTADVAFL